MDLCWPRWGQKHPQCVRRVYIDVCAVRSHNNVGCLLHFFPSYLLKGVAPWPCSLPVWLDRLVSKHRAHAVSTSPALASQVCMTVFGCFMCRLELGFCGMHFTDYAASLALSVYLLKWYKLWKIIFIYWSSYAFTSWLANWYCILELGFS